ncbi:MAG: F0F1 ATP synthase subunit A [Clostridia bacterium]
MTPINLIGEVANPISLSFRLMGNVLAGTIIMALYYGMLPMLAYIISPALHFYSMCLPEFYRASSSSCSV